MAAGMDAAEVEVDLQEEDVQDLDQETDEGVPGDQSVHVDQAVDAVEVHLEDLEVQNVLLVPKGNEAQADQYQNHLKGETEVPVDLCRNLL